VGGTAGTGGTDAFVLLLLAAGFGGLAATSGFAEAGFFTAFWAAAGALPRLADGAGFLLGLETLAGGFFDALLGAGFRVVFGFDAKGAWRWEDFGLVFKQRTGSP
jgi:hypothetical protein